MNFFKNLFRKRKYDYSHWDIHALARMMDPEAWAAFDALPDIDEATGRAKYYGSFKPVEKSFKMAVNLCQRGIFPCKYNLESDADVQNYMSVVKAKELVKNIDKKFITAIC